MMSHRKLTSILILFFSFLAATLTTVAAQQTTFVPSIGLRSEYDDNVTFRATDKISDFVGILSPAVSLDYASELGHLKGIAGLDFLGYLDESDLNTVHHRYRLEGGRRMTEKFGVSGNLGFIKDTTLESELEETGIVYTRSGRKRYTGGGGVSYQWTERSDVGFNYSYQETDYEAGRLVDYHTHRAGFLYKHKFNQGLDVITVGPSYSRTDSDVNRVNNYEMSLGWSRIFTETFSMMLLVGGRYTEVEQKLTGQEDENSGVIADINITKKWEIGSAVLGYKKDLYNNADGEAVDVDRIYLRVNRRLAGRLGGAFSGSLYFSNTEADFIDRDTTFYQLSPSLYYQLTERHTLSLGYTFARKEEERNADSVNFERNRVWLSLNFVFPRKW